MTDPERAARMDAPDLGQWDDVLPAPGSPSPLVKLMALNLPVIAILGAAGHAGHLDEFMDPLLGGWCGGIALVYVGAVIALARGNVDRAGWLGSRLTLLGMLGTLAGFMVAFGAVATAGDLESTKDAIGTLTQGLSLAILTTIVGLVCKLMLDAQVRWCK